MRTCASCKRVKDTKIGRNSGKAWGRARKSDKESGTTIPPYHISLAPLLAINHTINNIKLMPW